MMEYFEKIRSAILLVALAIIVLTVFQVNTATFVVGIVGSAIYGLHRDGLLMPIITRFKNYLGDM